LINITSTHSWEAEFPAAATAELLRYGRKTFEYTHEFYEVRNPAGEIVLTAGVAVWSPLRPPELWIVLAKPYFRNLRESLAVTGEALATPVSRWPSLVCEVMKTAKRELHFVNYFGWVPTGRKSLRPDGDNYIQFGVV
jgi:hypothetical protein